MESDEHHIAVSSLERALGPQIQHHLSANGNGTTVLKEIRLSLAPYLIDWCTVLKYRAFKCQNLCKLYKFKQDETSHGEDILQASVLDQFLTLTVWRYISQSDANCAAVMVLEDMFFGVLITGNLSAGKRCCNVLINDSICISVLHLDVRDPLVILSIIRPWDPGIFHGVAVGMERRWPRWQAKRELLCKNSDAPFFFSHAHDFPWILELGVIL